MAVRALEPWHLAILVFVFIALFGSRRLPDAARSIGESARILRRSMAGEDSPPPPAPADLNGSPDRDAPTRPA